MISWFLGFLASWFQSFKVPAFHNFNLFNLKCSKSPNLKVVTFQSSQSPFCQYFKIPKFHNFQIPQFQNCYTHFRTFPRFAILIFAKRICLEIMLGISCIFKVFLQYLRGPKSQIWSKFGKFPKCQK